MIKINCLFCNKEHFVREKEVKRGNGKFCSYSCSSKYNKSLIPKPLPNVYCAYCNKNYYLNNSKQMASKSGLYFCCREHKDVAQRIGGIKEIMPPHYGTAEPENSYRRTAFRFKAKICERCGYDKHEAAIIVHHKDRNRNNDSLDNLEVLCANCHAIEHWGEPQIDKN